MRKTILIFSCCAFFALAAMAQRTEALLEKNWKFTKGDVPEATQTNFDDSKWETVTIPHDWAIFGPFDRNNDLQEVAVTQDLEKQASVKTGRTGGLPYVGVGWYRTAFDASADKQVTLVFDGAMSEARVYVNGKEACFWPFGYNSFHCDVTGLLNADGKKQCAGCPSGKQTPVLPLVSGGGIVSQCPPSYYGTCSCSGLGYTAHHTACFC